MPYLAVMDREQDSFGAYIPELGGVFVVGKTEDEVRERLPQALALHLHALQEHGHQPPAPKAQRLEDLPSGAVHEFSDPLGVLVEPAELNPVSLEIERAMQAAGLRSPAELGARLGVSRQAASRLIDPFYWGHSLASLRKVAQVLNQDLQVQFTQPGRVGQSPDPRRAS